MRYRNSFRSAHHHFLVFDDADQLAQPIPKAKVAKWATRLYKICPDLVDQGFLSLKKLREHLAKETQFTLWWD